MALSSARCWSASPRSGPRKRAATSPTTSRAIDEALQASAAFYADSGAAPAEVVKSWADEGANYSYDSDSCADGKECGHYTQVVWRASVKVGCAKKSCTANSPFGADFPSWDLWVCDYSPAGNSGGKPY